MDQINKRRMSRITPPALTNNKQYIFFLSSAGPTSSTPEPLDSSENQQLNSNSVSSRPQSASRSSRSNRTRSRSRQRRQRRRARRMAEAANSASNGQQPPQNQGAASGSGVADEGPLSPEEEAKRSQIRTWPHSLSFMFACLTCTIGMFSISRFAILTIDFGMVFIVQFLLLSILFGIPLFVFHASLGQYLGSGIIDMWRISPIHQVNKHFTDFFKCFY